MWSQIRFVGEKEELRRLLRAVPKDLRQWQYTDGIGVGQMVVMEDQRAESMQGVDRGKKVSRRPDVKARTHMVEHGMCINQEQRPLGHIPGIPVGHKWVPAYGSPPLFPSM